MVFSAMVALFDEEEDPGCNGQCWVSARTFAQQVGNRHGQYVHRLQKELITIMRILPIEHESTCSPPG